MENDIIKSLAIDCGLLQAPLNGSVDFTSTVLSSIASYTCDKGFTLKGNNTRECQINEEWSGKEPQCNGKNTN